ncbi:MAG: TrkA family potassium uptake protein [Spirochaetes bacterium]|nr:TrkA family potassium uptake protein [Spirochaetota bacterium]
MNRVLILGLGSFGMSLCENLVKEGVEVIAIDNNPSKTNLIKNMVVAVYEIDIRNEDFLNIISDIKNIDYAVICVGDNMEASLLSALTLKENTDIPVIARATSKQHQKILKAIGVDEIIFLEEEVGERLAQRISKGHVYNYVPLSGDHKIIDVKVSPGMVGKMIKDLNIREKYKVNIIAIKSKIAVLDKETFDNVFKEEVKEVPTGDYVLKDNDIMVVVGKNLEVDSFVEAVERDALD